MRYLCVETATGTQILWRQVFQHPGGMGEKVEGDKTR